MVTAIVSLVSGRPVSEQVAMTGEVTLSGQVLGIGGVRDKVLAAQRAGVRRVILPKENEPDLADLPTEARKEIEFVLTDHVDEVLAAAFDGASPVRAPRRVGSPERKAAAPA
jgi:ATP-dependent Lon protease